jgi:hypothetical protein
MNYPAKKKQFSKDKHSSLFSSGVSDNEKQFYNITTGVLAALFPALLATQV